MRRIHNTHINTCMSMFAQIFMDVWLVQWSSRPYSVNVTCCCVLSEWNQADNLKCKRWRCFSGGRTLKRRTKVKYQQRFLLMNPHRSAFLHKAIIFGLFPSDVSRSGTIFVSSAGDAGAEATVGSELWGVTEIGHLSSCNLPTPAAHLWGTGAEDPFHHTWRLLRLLLQIKGQTEQAVSFTFPEWSKE